MNKRAYAAVILLLCLAHDATGTGNHPAGARSMALSNASVSLADIWSSFHNQAGLAFQRKVSAGFYYESRFNIDELSLSAATLVLPLKNENLGLSFFQFGKDIYKEQKLGLSLSKKLTSKLSAGIQFDYFLRTLPETEKPSGFATAEAGFLLKLNDNLSIGAHCFNPVRNGYKTFMETDKMSSVIRAGGNYKFNNNALLAVEARKESLLPVIYKTGIEFYPVEKIALRFGASVKPFCYSAGIGYEVGFLIAEIGFSYHENLGLTPSVSIQLNWQ